MSLFVPLAKNVIFIKHIYIFNIGFFSVNYLSCLVYSEDF